MKNVIGRKHSTREVCLLSFQAFRPCSWIKSFFFQFYPEVWTVCRIWCIYLGARAVKSMDIRRYHALGARQEFVSHLFLDKLLYGNLAAVCNGVKEEVGWGVWPTSCQTYRLFTCFGVQREVSWGIWTPFPSDLQRIYLFRDPGGSGGGSRGPSRLTCGYWYYST